ncbi:hypothetical protein BESB_054000 [Besnoitia besnoiti]|uniref:Uncharacterized protein n=1 Tax=Besnoitia besnoiti TaxID=94643 RepID=A0A2A9MCZ8_BESBE|nr:hypothetical protein BESB_054000 [Besnoitia besnoiti]PFH35749.1 hypothetical protein BESB_054000 [Besnoitia besnoiti]
MASADSRSAEDEVTQVLGDDRLRPVEGLYSSLGTRDNLVRISNLTPEKLPFNECDDYPSSFPASSYETVVPWMPPSAALSTPSHPPCFKNNTQTGGRLRAGVVSSPVAPRSDHKVAAHVGMSPEPPLRVPSFHGKDAIKLRPEPQSPLSGLPPLSGLSFGLMPQGSSWPSLSAQRAAHPLDYPKLRPTCASDETAAQPTTASAGGCSSTNIFSEEQVGSHGHGLPTRGTDSSSPVRKQAKPREWEKFESRAALSSDATRFSSVPPSPSLLQRSRFVKDPASGEVTGRSNGEIQVLCHRHEARVSGLHQKPPSLADVEMTLHGFDIAQTPPEHKADLSYSNECDPGRWLTPAAQLHNSQTVKQCHSQLPQFSGSDTPHSLVRFHAHGGEHAFRHEATDDDPATRKRLQPAPLPPRGIAPHAGGAHLGMREQHATRTSTSESRMPSGLPRGRGFPGCTAVVELAGSSQLIRPVSPEPDVRARLQAATGDGSSRESLPLVLEQQINPRPHTSSPSKAPCLSASGGHFPVTAASGNKETGRKATQGTSQQMNCGLQHHLLSRITHSTSLHRHFLDAIYRPSSGSNLRSHPAWLVSPVSTNEGAVAALTDSAAPSACQAANGSFQTGLGQPGFWSPGVDTPALTIAANVPMYSEARLPPSHARREYSGATLGKQCGHTAALPQIDSEAPVLPSHNEHQISTGLRASGIQAHVVRCFPSEKATSHGMQPTGTIHHRITHEALELMAEPHDGELDNALESLLTHIPHSTLMYEMCEMTFDFRQERQWKQCVALAVGREAAGRAPQRQLNSGPHKHIAAARPPRCDRGASTLNAEPYIKPPHASRDPDCTDDQASAPLLAADTKRAAEAEARGTSCGTKTGEHNEVWDGGSISLDSTEISSGAVGAVTQEGRAAHAETDSNKTTGEASTDTQRASDCRMEFSKTVACREGAPQMHECRRDDPAVLTQKLAEAPKGSGDQLGCFNTGGHSLHVSRGACHQRKCVLLNTSSGGRTVEGQRVLRAGCESMSCICLSAAASVQNVKQGGACIHLSNAEGRPSRQIDSSRLRDGPECCVDEPHRGMQQRKVECRPGPDRNHATAAASATSDVRGSLMETEPANSHDEGRLHVDAIASVPRSSTSLLGQGETEVGVGSLVQKDTDKQHPQSERDREFSGKSQVPAPHPANECVEINGNTSHCQEGIAGAHAAERSSLGDVEQRPDASENEGAAAAEHRVEDWSGAATDNIAKSISGSNAETSATDHGDEEKLTNAREDPSAVLHSPMPAGFSRGRAGIPKSSRRSKRGCRGFQICRATRAPAVVPDPSDSLLSAPHSCDLRAAGLATASGKGRGNSSERSENAKREHLALCHGPEADIQRRKAATEAWLAERERRLETILRASVIDNSSGAVEDGHDGLPRSATPEKAVYLGVFESTETGTTHTHTTVERSPCVPRKKPSETNSSPPSQRGRAYRSALRDNAWCHIIAEKTESQPADCDVDANPLALHSCRLTLSSELLPPADPALVESTASQGELPRSAPEAPPRERRKGHAKLRQDNESEYADTHTRQEDGKELALPREGRCGLQEDHSPPCAADSSREVSGRIAEDDLSPQQKRTSGETGKLRDTGGLPEPSRQKNRGDAEASPLDDQKDARPAVELNERPQPLGLMLRGRRHEQRGRSRGCPRRSVRSAVAAGTEEGEGSCRAVDAASSLPETSAGALWAARVQQSKPEGQRPEAQRQTSGDVADVDQPEERNTDDQAQMKAQLDCSVVGNNGSTRLNKADAQAPGSAGGSRNCAAADKRPPTPSPSVTTASGSCTWSSPRNAGGRRPEDDKETKREDRGDSGQAQGREVSGDGIGEAPTSSGYRSGTKESGQTKRGRHTHAAKHRTADCCDSDSEAQNTAVPRSPEEQGRDTRRPHRADQDARGRPCSCSKRGIQKEESGTSDGEKPLTQAQEQPYASGFPSEEPGPRRRKKSRHDHTVLGCAGDTDHREVEERSVESAETNGSAGADKASVPPSCSLLSSAVQSFWLGIAREVAPHLLPSTLRPLCLRLPPAFSSFSASMARHCKSRETQLLPASFSLEKRDLNRLISRLQASSAFVGAGTTHDVVSQAPRKELPLSAHLADSFPPSALSADSHVQVGARNEGLLQLLNPSASLPRPDIDASSRCPAPPASGPRVSSPQASYLTCYAAGSRWSAEAQESGAAARVASGACGASVGAPLSGELTALTGAQKDLRGCCSPHTQARCEDPHGAKEGRLPAEKAERANCVRESGREPKLEHANGGKASGGAADMLVAAEEAHLENEAASGDAGPEKHERMEDADTGPAGRILLYEEEKLSTRLERHVRHSRGEDMDSTFLPRGDETPTQRDRLKVHRTPGSICTGRPGSLNDQSCQCSAREGASLPPEGHRPSGAEAGVNASTMEQTPPVGASSTQDASASSSLSGVAPSHSACASPLQPPLTAESFPSCRRRECPRSCASPLCPSPPPAEPPAEGVDWVPSLDCLPSLNGEQGENEEEGKCLALSPLQLPSLGPETKATGGRDPREPQCLPPAHFDLASSTSLPAAAAGPPLQAQAGHAVEGRIGRITTEETEKDSAKLSPPFNASVSSVPSSSEPGAIVQNKAHDDTAVAPEEQVDADSEASRTPRPACASPADFLRLSTSDCGVHCLKFFLRDGVSSGLSVALAIRESRGHEMPCRVRSTAAQPHGSRRSPSLQREHGGLQADDDSLARTLHGPKEDFLPPAGESCTGGLLRGGLSGAEIAISETEFAPESRARHSETESLAQTVAGSAPCGPESLRRMSPVPAPGEARRKGEENVSQEAAYAGAEGAYDAASDKAPAEFFTGTGRGVHAVSSASSESHLPSQASVASSEYAGQTATATCCSHEDAQPRDVEGRAFEREDQLVARPGPPSFSHRSLPFFSCSSSAAGSWAASSVPHPSLSPTVRFAPASATPPALSSSSSASPGSHPPGAMVPSTSPLPPAAVPQQHTCFSSRSFSEHAPSNSPPAPSSLPYASPASLASPDALPASSLPSASTSHASLSASLRAPPGPFSAYLSAASTPEFPLPPNSNRPLPSAASSPIPGPPSPSLPPPSAPFVAHPSPPALPPSHAHSAPSPCRTSLQQPCAFAPPSSPAGRHLSRPGAYSSAPEPPSSASAASASPVPTASPSLQPAPARDSGAERAASGGGTARLFDLASHSHAGRQTSRKSSSRGDRKQGSHGAAGAAAIGAGGATKAEEDRKRQARRRRRGRKHRPKRASSVSRIQTNLGVELRTRCRALFRQRLAEEYASRLERERRRLFSILSVTPGLTQPATRGLQHASGIVCSSPAPHPPSPWSAVSSSSSLFTVGSTYSSPPSMSPLQPSACWSSGRGAAVRRPSTPFASSRRLAASVSQLYPAVPCSVGNDATSKSPNADDAQPGDTAGSPDPARSALKEPESGGTVYADRVSRWRATRRKGRTRTQHSEARRVAHVDSEASQGKALEQEAGLTTGLEGRSTGWQRPKKDNQLLHEEKGEVGAHTTARQVAGTEGGVDGAKSEERTAVGDAGLPPNASPSLRLRLCDYWLSFEWPQPEAWAARGGDGACPGNGDSSDHVVVHGRGETVEGSETQAGRARGNADTPRGQRNQAGTARLEDTPHARDDGAEEQARSAALPTGYSTCKAERPEMPGDTAGVHEAPEQPVRGGLELERRGNRPGHEGAKRAKGNDTRSNEETDACAPVLKRLGEAAREPMTKDESAQTPRRTNDENAPKERHEKASVDGEGPRQDGARVKISARGGGKALKETKDTEDATNEHVGSRVSRNGNDPAEEQKREGTSPKTESANADEEFAASRAEEGLRGRAGGATQTPNRRIKAESRDEEPRKGKKAEREREYEGKPAPERRRPKREGTDGAAPSGNGRQARRTYGNKQPMCEDRSIPHLVFSDEDDVEDRECEYEQGRARVGEECKLAKEFIRQSPEAPIPALLTARTEGGGETLERDGNQEEGNMKKDDTEAKLASSSTDHQCDIEADSLPLRDETAQHLHEGSGAESQPMPHEKEAGDGPECKESPRTPCSKETREGSPAAAPDASRSLAQSAVDMHVPEGTKIESTEAKTKVQLASGTPQDAAETAEDGAVLSRPEPLRADESGPLPDASACTSLPFSHVAASAFDALLARFALSPEVCASSAAAVRDTQATGEGAAPTACATDAQSAVGGELSLVGGRRGPCLFSADADSPSGSAFGCRSALANPEGSFGRLPSPPLSAASCCDSPGQSAASSASGGSPRDRSPVSAAETLTDSQSRGDEATRLDASCRNKRARGVSPSGGGGYGAPERSDAQAKRARAASVAGADTPPGETQWHDDSAGRGQQAANIIADAEAKGRWTPHAEAAASTSPAQKGDNTLLHSAAGTETAKIEHGSKEGGANEPSLSTHALPETTQRVPASAGDDARTEVERDADAISEGSEEGRERGDAEEARRSRLEGSQNEVAITRGREEVGTEGGTGNGTERLKTDAAEEADLATLAVRQSLLIEALFSRNHNEAATRDSLTHTDASLSTRETSSGLETWMSGCCEELELIPFPDVRSSFLLSLTFLTARRRQRRVHALLVRGLKALEETLDRLGDRGRWGTGDSSGDEDEDEGEKHIRRGGEESDQKEEDRDAHAGECRCVRRERDEADDEEQRQDRRKHQPAERTGPSDEVAERGAREDSDTREDEQ